MAKYRYEMIYNESLETEGSEEFVFPHNEAGVIEATTFEGVLYAMKDKWDSLSNGEWDWEINERGTVGEIRFNNGEDGMAVVFDVRKQ
jgi:hypothetical protein